MPKDNRLILALGAVLAVVVAAVAALFFSNRGGDEPAGPAEPAERGGLQLDIADAPELAPTRELRCFVDGQFVGMATLTDCARRNGVATEALDVGVDETGALAAAPTAVFAPPPSAPPIELTEVAPPVIAPPTAQPAPSTPAPAPVESGAPCLRHAGGEWRAVSTNSSQAACVQALFAGSCVRPGDALYGRWGDVTLRLVPRRVEQSQDNSRFRTYAEQDRNCQFPGLR